MTCRLVPLLAASTSLVVLMTATTLALPQAPERAGSASGLLGIVHFTVGALCAPLAGAGGSASAFVGLLVRTFALDKKDEVAA